LAVARAAIASRDDCKGIESVATGSDGRITLVIGIGRTAAGQTAADQYAHDNAITWEDPAVNAWMITPDANGQPHLGPWIPVRNGGTTSKAVLTPPTGIKPGQQAAVFLYGAAETVDLDSKNYAEAVAGSYCGTIVATVVEGTPGITWRVDQTAPAQPDTFRTRACAIEQQGGSQYTIPC
jgi:hypothetical protein